MDKENTYSLLLLLGLIVGAGMAAISIVEESNLTNYEWAAKIEETTISMEKYLTQLEGLSKDKRSPITEQDKAYVLERMIEEELLIKRAIDLGMIENNPMARGTIVQQMIKTIIFENDRYEISDQELKAFYEENKGFFTKSTRLRVQQIYFSNDGDGLGFERSMNAYELLSAGEPFDEVYKLGDQSALIIPNTLMTLSKVREYIGPSLMNLANQLEVGSFTKPVEVPGGHKIIILLDKESLGAPDFLSIKDSVRAEFSKRRDDSSLRDYLENLKNWYDVSRNLPN